MLVLALHMLAAFFRIEKQLPRHTRDPVSYTHLDVYKRQEWVYVLLLSDEIIKIPLTTWRYKTRVWLRNVTR